MFLKYIPYLVMAISALMSGKIAFRLGSFQVSVFDSTGKPVHLTLAAAEAAARAVAAGQIGTLTCGVVSLQIAPYVAV